MAQKKSKMNVYGVASYRSGVMLVEVLCYELKLVIHAGKPSNVDEIKQFCNEEWVKIPPQ